MSKTITLPTATELLKNLPSEMPEYLEASKVEEELDSIEADDLDGKLIGLVDKMEKVWQPKLNEQVELVIKWRDSLEAITKQVQNFPKTKERIELQKELRKELETKYKTESKRIKPFLKGWKSESKATRIMLKNLAPRGKTDPVYIAVKDFLEFIQLQYQAMETLPKRLNMAANAVKRIK